MRVTSRKVAWFASAWIIVTVLLCFRSSAPAAGLRVITLASWEYVPYVGEDLPRGGYATELVRTAFERAGYRLRVIIVPAARALHLAKVGAVDGVMPVAAEGPNLEGLELSQGFPGDRLGVLKRRATNVSIPSDAPLNSAQFWRALQPYRLGLLRGEYELSGAARVPGMRLELAASDLQNIDKLAHKRVDLLVIDRFTAADVILSHRPHLVGELQFVRPQLAVRPFHVGFPRDKATSRALRERFDRALAQLTKDGTVERIRALHGMRNLEERKPHDG
jgi:sorbitol/mannitol transport system substrate-binding protein